MLCGILEPTEGEGRVLGIDLRRDPERVKSAIGYMSQRFSLYDDLTVEENLMFYARVYMVPLADPAGRIQQMLRLGDLGGYPRQLAGQLSGGYRQRLALTYALVHGPRLVFLDEPTAGVDPVSRRTFWAVVRRLADEGTTILVTTHYMDEAELCDTLGFIYQGRLIAHGSPAEIKAETFARPVIELQPVDARPAADDLAYHLLDGGPLRQAISGDPAGARRRRGGGARVRLIAARSDLQVGAVRDYLAARGVRAEWANEVEPNVEDLFVSFVDRERKARVREQLRALGPAGR